MFRTSRRSATKVHNGQVQRKNRHDQTPHYLTHEMPSLVIDRKRPGEGYRHLVFQDEIRRFLDILPQWGELRLKLDAIVMDEGGDCMGWHRSGVVAICAWDRSIEIPAEAKFIEEHREVFEKLGIPYRLKDNSAIGLIEFNELTAKAFQLIHVLVHELGHHHDRMTTRSQNNPARGETYAEAYARQWEDEILHRYRFEFDL